MPDSHDIAVVIPVYNSAKTLEELFVRTKDSLEAMNLDFEVIFVDDNSQDDSWKVIQKLKSTNKNHVKGFQLAQNSGQQAATFCGLQQANSLWVVTMDDDLQYPPEEILRLWDAAHKLNSDIIYGVAMVDRQNLARRFGAKCFRLLTKNIAPGFPNSSSFRLIKREILENLPKHLWQWSYVDPVLVWLTSNRATVTISQLPRQSGKSGYSLLKLTAIAGSILIIYSTLLLRIMVVLGFITATISLVLGVYFIIQKLTVGAEMGFSAIIVTISFASGVILICLGILGIYLSKIYRMSSGQPAFLIKRKI